MALTSRTPLLAASEVGWERDFCRTSTVVPHITDIRIPTSPVIWSAPVLLVPSRCRKRINVYEWTRSAWARGSGIAQTPAEATEVDADPDLDSDSGSPRVSIQARRPASRYLKDASAPRAVRSVGFVDSDESMRVAYGLAQSRAVWTCTTGVRVAVCAPRLRDSAACPRDNRASDWDDLRRVLQVRSSLFEFRPLTPDSRGSRCTRSEPPNRRSPRWCTCPCSRATRRT